MNLSLIQTNQFSIWMQMRVAVYGDLEDNFHETEMRQIIDREDWFCYFLMDDKNQILGMVELSARNIVDGCLSSPVAYIEGLYLLEKYRGLGFGKVAMSLILRWCKEHGFTELATDSELENINAQGYFQALGFTETYRIVEFCIAVE